MSWSYTTHVRRKRTHDLIDVHIMSVGFSYLVVDDDDDDDERWTLLKAICCFEPKSLLMASMLTDRSFFMGWIS